MMQEDLHIFQGMRRDTHQINQKAEYLWDARNIRITDRENSSLFSISNEKGTYETSVEYNGSYIGHCVLNEYLIVFTKDNNNDYIYRTKKGIGYENVILYKGKLNFSSSYPIDAIGVYESELIQKVYWIDGHNQPRMINIVYPEYKNIPKANDYTESYKDISFDFVVKLKLKEDVKVDKILGNGMFAPGVIQYAFTYYNKYGQESAIFHTTPLQYITHADRGGNGEDKIGVTFKIHIDNLDNFDYIRTYSIHRTSIDAVPTVKLVTDTYIRDLNNSVDILDPGTIGETVDNTQLLYLGGREIIAGCIEQKDNTLFFGNLTIQEDTKWNEFKDKVKDNCIFTGYESYSKEVPTEGEYYRYEMNPDIRGFKMGEIYRLGIQFQKSNGSWTEPVHLRDDILNTTYPGVDNSSIKWYSKKVQLSKELQALCNNNGYVKMRTCVVYPTIHDRSIVCQGIINPTVFSVKNRVEGSPYAVSSWFFRPMIEVLHNSRINAGADIQSTHNKSLYTGNKRGAEIQVSSSLDAAIDISEASQYDKSLYFVDSNILTLHSPDIEFDDALHNLDLESNYTLRILGAVKLKSIAGDIDIQTSTPVAGSKSSGFQHNKIGFPIGSKYISNGGLVSGLFYEDTLIKKEVKDDTTTWKPGTVPYNYFVYPWHKSGSLNNDENRSDGSSKTAILRKKVISNLKYFDGFTAINDSNYDIKPQLFSSNEVELLKIWVPYLNKSVPYLGNVDTMITTDDEYPLFIGNSFVDNPTPIKESDSNLFETKDPVRMKYKSTPHMVFSLGKGNTLALPPSITGNTGTYTLPIWDTIDDSHSDDKVLGAAILKVGADEVIKHTYRDGSFNIILNEGKLYIYYYPKAGFSLKFVTKHEAIDNLKVGNLFVIRGDGNNIFTESFCNAVGINWTTLSSASGLSSKYRSYIGSDIYLEIIEIVRGEITSCKLQVKTVNTNTSNLKKWNISSTKLDSSKYNNSILIAEIVKDVNINTRFGGDTPEALRANIWYPAGDAVNIDGYAEFKYGDTWYQRYDCLKTYPFTKEDENQIVEIGSFMCESRVNIDGRWDRNRGQYSNLNMSPENFNLLNDVYSQKDNFFTYRQLDPDFYKINTFVNQITWSKTKWSSEETDQWTNITLANTLDLDGTYGKVTAIKGFNDTLIALQEHAVNHIMFNSRVQIQASDGVPIEIANSQKVDGYRVISDNTGCINKWSVQSTSMGIYFIDDLNKSLMLFNGEIQDLGTTSDMKWWINKISSISTWSPNKSGSNNIRTFYDRTRKDVYFTPGPMNINQEDALCFSEQLNQCMSFFSYGGTSAMFNYEEDFCSLYYGNKLRLYEHFKGEYNTFFGRKLPYSISFISNANPTLTKVFDTINITADLIEDDKAVGDTYTTYRQPGIPFTNIEVSNEYQHAKVMFNSSTLRKKFRIWRALIPRQERSRARIRNPWTLIKLSSDTPWTENMILHNLTVRYTI